MRIGNARILLVDFPAPSNGRQTQFAFQKPESVESIFQNFQNVAPKGITFQRITVPELMSTNLENDFDIIVSYFSGSLEEQQLLIQKLASRLSGIPILAIVPNDTHEVRLKILQLGVSEVLEKHLLESSAFYSAVFSTIERKRREQMLDGQSFILDLLAKGQPQKIVLEALVRYIEQNQNGSYCSILLLDSDGKHLELGAAPSLPEEYNQRVSGLSIGPKEGSCGTAAWLGKQVIVADIDTDPLWQKYRLLANEYDLASCWSQPIFSSSGRVLGTFAIYRKEKHIPAPSELRLIERAASLAAIAIEQRSAEVALRYRFDFEKLIFSTSTRFISTSSENIDEECLRALEDLGRFAGVERSYIFLLADDGREATKTHEWTLSDEYSKASLRMVNANHFPWFCKKLAQQEVVYIRDSKELPHDALPERVEMERQGIYSLIVVPMIQGRRVIGFVGLDSLSKEKNWSADAVVLLKLFSQIFANAFERKRVERELRTSQEQFLQNEAQLRLTFNSAQLGMATCSLDGRLLSVNNAFCKMIGYEASELLHLNFNDFSHPDDRKIPRGKIRDLLRGYTSTIEIDKRYIHKNGSLVHTIKRLGAIFDSQKKPLYLVAEIEDITEKKKWEAEYLKACKLESLGILAGGIAHDFNNILMAMLGSISFTKLEVDPESRMYERLSDVEKAVYRARDLTHQLLTFSKGGAPIKKTAAVSEIIRDTLGFTLTGTSVSYKLYAPDNLWPVRVDEGQISQVIHNLILNACQAMPDGGNITVHCENMVLSRRTTDYGPPLKSGRYVKISVRDEGCGISAENLSKIFDPFFSTKEGGSGLGLATSYSILKRHQGHIEVESQPGTGTEFHLYIPATPTGVLSSRIEVSQIKPGHGKILLMDDEPMVRTAAGNMLEKLGYHVDFAKNGTEALALYERAQQRGEPFAAVIMDLTIPGGMGGRVAIRKLRKLDPGVKAIVSSGYADGPVMAQYRKYGFRGVMAKPYEISTLSSVLSDVINDSTE